MALRDTNLRLFLLNHWDTVRNSYWFLPALMALVAMLLSVATLHLDAAYVGKDLGNAWWVYTGSANGARDVLQTIATSMIGVAGVVFSITTVTLSLAANKFGPRIFRNFMSDTGNQVVLGTFISTFLFCLLILRQVRGSDNGSDVDRFIPQVSLLVGVALAICSLAVLIYFIHHVAWSIQATNVIANIGRDLLAGIRNLYPEQIGDAPPRGEREKALIAQVPPRLDAESVDVRAASGGYIRRIEAQDLIKRATAEDLIIHVVRQPGDFVIAGDVILRAWPAERVVQNVADALRSAVVVGDQRTPAQDIRFPLGQLTEVACLALSSGINDYYTAVLCVDRLGEGLAFLADRTIPSPYRADESGRLRVIAPPIDLPTLLHTAFGPILQNSTSQPQVLSRLFDALARIAQRAPHPDTKEAVVAFADHARRMRAETLQAAAR